MIGKKNTYYLSIELVVQTVALAIGAPSSGSSDPTYSGWGPELWELGPRGCFSL